MQTESRFKKTILNARVNLFFYFVTLILTFFSRKIFLNSLGDDFVGLVGTLQNLLGLLNLAEMGIGTAIGYVLYKPLFTQDRDKIDEIISVFGYLYRIVGLVILFVGIILGCLLPVIFSDVNVDIAVIYFAYLTFLTSSLIGYFINYRQTLLGADQKNYIITSCFQSVNICRILLQMYLSSITGNYYIWITIELVFGIIYSFVLNWRINKVYPWLDTNISLGRKLFSKYPEIIQYTKQLFVHKLGSVAYQQVSPFLVYAFASLKTVAYYGNYTLIISKLNALVNNLLGSTFASVGNLIAEGNKDKILQVYWELMAVRFCISCTFIYSLFYLLPSFISLWLGPQYIMRESILYLLLLNYFLGLNRGTNEQFIMGFGLFYDTWAPFTETIIMILLSSVGGKFFGIEGVLMGGIVSTIIIVFIWKPYFLFSKGFKSPLKEYWIPWIMHIILMMISWSITELSLRLLSVKLDECTSWKAWVIDAIVVTSFSGIVSLIIYLCGTKGMRQFVRRIFTHLNVNQ